MGTYATAHIFYGYVMDDDVMYDLTHEDGEYTDEEFDYAEMILKERGIVDPWDSHPDTDNMDYDTQREVHKVWYEQHKEELDAWYDAKREVDQKISVEMSTYGHYDESHYYLAVKGTQHTASPSYPTSLDEDLWVDPKWTDQLDTFLQAYGIEPPEDGPCWWLVASYG